MERLHFIKLFSSMQISIHILTTITLSLWAFANIWMCKTCHMLIIVLRFSPWHLKIDDCRLPIRNTIWSIPLARQLKLMRNTRTHSFPHKHIWNSLFKIQHTKRQDVLGKSTINDRLLTQKSREQIYSTSAKHSSLAYICTTCECVWRVVDQHGQ